MMVIIPASRSAFTVTLRSGAVNKRVGSVSESNLVFSRASFEFDTMVSSLKC